MMVGSALTKFLMSPSYKDAMFSGMEWTVIAWQVSEHCPELAVFLSEAGNSGHGAREPTKVQQLLTIYSKARRNKQMTGDCLFPSRFSDCVSSQWLRVVIASHSCCSLSLTNFYRFAVFRFSAKSRERVPELRSQRILGPRVLLCEPFSPGRGLRENPRRAREEPGIVGWAG